MEALPKLTCTKYITRYLQEQLKICFHARSKYVISGLMGNFMVQTEIIPDFIFVLELWSQLNDLGNNFDLNIKSTR